MCGHALFPYLLVCQMLKFVSVMPHTLVPCECKYCHIAGATKFQEFHLSSLYLTAATPAAATSLPKGAGAEPLAQSRLQAVYPSAGVLRLLRRLTGPEGTTLILAIMPH